MWDSAGLADWDSVVESAVLGTDVVALAVSAVLELTAGVGLAVSAVLGVTEGVGVTASE